MDIIFNDDILLKDLPHPAYLAAAPEFERDTKKNELFQCWNISHEHPRNENQISAICRDDEKKGKDLLQDFLIKGT